MQGFSKFLWLLSGFAALLAAVWFAAGSVVSPTAIQQGSVALQALTLALVPYALATSFDRMGS